MLTSTRATGSSLASAAPRQVRGLARGTFAFRTVSRMSASCSGAPPSGSADCSLSLLTAKFLPDTTDSGPCPGPFSPAGRGRTHRGPDTACGVRAPAYGRERQAYSPAALRSASTRSVRSQVKSGSSRPKWPYAAVWA